MWAIIAGMSPVADKPVIVPDREQEHEKTHDPSGPRIRCPLCGWSPRKEDKWFCTCGNEWNTFDTGGVCPACLHQWTETECRACSRWSPTRLGIQADPALNEAIAEVRSRYR
jgi:hypothetical protein